MRPRGALTGKSTIMTQENTDAPISNFSNCHVGIIRRLDALADLPAMLAAAARAHETAEQSLAFFRTVIFEHHQEEERELFPAVIASAQAGEERKRVDTMATRLTDEHREIEKIWKGLEKGLTQVVKGKSSVLDVAALNDLIARYRAHAAFEEAEFLPLCEQILGRDQHHMAALGLSLHMRHVKEVPGYL